MRRENLEMITAEIEEWLDVLPELKPMFPAHHRELALFQDRMPLNIQFGVYADRNIKGELVVAIVREDGKVIGYWVTFVAPGLHYGSTLTATMDVLWIKPENRGDGSGRMLAACLEKELKRRGVKVWWVGSKNHKEIEGFYEHLGFKHEESYFARWIGG